MSVSHERLLLLKNATVNWNLGFDDVCKEKHVFVAYNNELPTFGVSNITGEMMRRPVTPQVEYLPMAWEWEVQEKFFEANNLKPIWLNCNFTWGWYDNVTESWTGATGMVASDKADYALFGFSGTYDRSTVVAFSPGLQYLPYRWLTRYPQELSPTWNLFGLFTKEKNSQICNAKTSFKFSSLKSKFKVIIKLCTSPILPESNQKSE